jgi:arylsulfatase A-like enzyme
VEGWNLGRRRFLRKAGAGAVSAAIGAGLAGCRAWGQHRAKKVERKPNLVFVFADQWRAEATDYAGNKDVVTPNLDKLAGESVNFTTAVSGCPVCCPYRASLTTGQYLLTHGVFLNDVPLSSDAVTIGKVYRQMGYATAYIGKWHLDGIDRGAFIPRDRRQGFEFWRAYGCTHSYNESYYYADENVKLKWDGYDAIAQTHEAVGYIREHASNGPFMLFVSWGPPHEPYHTAPEKYRQMFKPESLTLRPNVPKEHETAARETLAGYYAHIAAMDECIGEIVRALEETGIEEETILVFTSDHGDMLYSHGFQKKQQPWDESILVPFLIRYPVVLGGQTRRIEMPINTPDIMPMLLGLSGIEVPDTVQGHDFSAVLRGQVEPADNAALISCPSPFGQWNRSKGGREYRGVRTRRYTYVRDLNGPWLLYDNQDDPYQLENLAGKPGYKKLQDELDRLLSRKLKETNDEFLSGGEYIRKWGYKVDQSGTVSYKS